MEQWVKHLALSLLRLRLLLRLGFDPWPGNFCMLQAQPKKEKKTVLPLLRPPSFCHPKPCPLRFFLETMVTPLALPGLLTPPILPSVGHS